MALYYKPSCAKLQNFSDESMHPSSLSLLPSSLQQQTGSTDQDLVSLVSKSILMLNDMDDALVSSHGSGKDWSAPAEMSPALTPSSIAAIASTELTPPPWSTAASVAMNSLDSVIAASGEPQIMPTWSASPESSIVVTPPPEGPPPPYPYPSTWYNLPPCMTSLPPAVPTSDMNSNLTNYFYNEYSPLSSPGSSDSNMQETYHHPSTMALPMSSSSSPLCTGYSSMVMNKPVTTPAVATTTSDDLYEAPKEIKMPQRKGGIQLWQFLSYLLNNPEKKHHDLIEWTANKHEREFRMLEPESIAIWWGYHKNKPGMTYDKFSRSLRYYYDKGILKKIQGERFVYRFLIDPEVMYEHIGTSDCRPKVKPMPKAAKAAMTKFQKSSSTAFRPQAVRVTQEAETLEKSLATDVSTVHTSLQSSAVPSSQPWGTHQSTTCGSNSLSFSEKMQCSASADNLPRCSEVLAPPPIKRCKSLDDNRKNHVTDCRIPLFFPTSSFPPIDNGYKSYLSTELQVHTETHDSFTAPLSTPGYDMFCVRS